MILKKEEICFMPAYEVRDVIIRQEMSSQEITEIMIERIEQINLKLNAFCTPTFDFARAAAKDADQAVKKGDPLGLLHGIPISIKDEMPLKGVRTTFGSKLYEDYVPEETDISVQRLQKEGSAILGKTNMPEFGCFAVTYNKIFGESRNPWDLNRTPGGSTGGGAAAVVSGLCFLSLGADGGGSIRIPASLCGAYGIKPSFGRVPVYPTSGLHFESLIHYGPLVRYVKDAALMLDAMKGPHQADMYSLPEQKISYFENVDEKPNKLKIGYTLNLGFSKVIDPEVKENVEKSAQKFSQLGWEVEQTKFKIKNPERCFLALYGMTVYYDLMRDLEKNPDLLDPELVKAAQVGAGMTGVDVARAMSLRKKYFDQFYHYFQDYDILITPTTNLPAFELGQIYPSMIDGKMVSPTAWMPFTAIFNLTGLPAASIPCGWSSDGLPIGMQIIGRQFDDLTVLQVSKAFEEITPWQEKKPTFT
jgi:Asp-tRNA(Asn)/Glu-tRNA(Gln) amidotransferase A subunit family amidase